MHLRQLSLLSRKGRHRGLPLPVAADSAAADYVSARDLVRVRGTHSCTHQPYQSMNATLDAYESDRNAGRPAEDVIADIRKRL